MAVKNGIVKQIFMAWLIMYTFNQTVKKNCVLSNTELQFILCRCVGKPWSMQPQREYTARLLAKNPVFSMCYFLLNAALQISPFACCSELLTLLTY